MKTLVQLSIFITILYTIAQTPNYAPKQEPTIIKNTVVEQVKAVEPPAPKVVEPIPEDPKGYAQYKVTQVWGKDHWEAFNNIITHESSWNPTAQNPHSTAYGLGQFLSSTMKNYGLTKNSTPQEQIDAVIRYISDRYGSPNEAYEFRLENGWY